MNSGQNENIKYSTIYDSFTLQFFATFFFVTFAGYLWIIIAKVEHPSGSLRAGFGHLICLTWPYVLFPCVVFSLRRRRIDQKGVFATFFGIRYKCIRWEHLESSHTEKYAPIIWRGKSKYDLYRDAIFFTSQPNRKGKTTIIIVYATDKAYAVVEKYFGPPSSVANPLDNQSKSLFTNMTQ